MFDSRDIEYKYLGPHPDARKTKELQDQGKKINLSLSEVPALVIAGIEKRLLPARNRHGDENPGRRDTALAPALPRSRPSREAAA